MKEHPILMNGEMVCAILEGRKTQTRRVMKPQPRHSQVSQSHAYQDCWYGHGEFDLGAEVWKCPFGQIGDRLWVREAFKVDYAPHAPDGHYHMTMTADGFRQEFDYSEVHSGRIKPGESYPSIHMPRWASRITLEITDVRAQRLQGISESDAMDEGAGATVPWHAEWYGDPDEYRKRFRELWESIYAKQGNGWATNPWMWAISFKAVKP